MMSGSILTIYHNVSHHAESLICLFEVINWVILFVNSYLFFNFCFQICILRWNRIFTCIAFKIPFWLGCMDKLQCDEDIKLHWFGTIFLLQIKVWILWMFFMRNLFLINLFFPIVSFEFTASWSSLLRERDIYVSF